MKIQLTWKGSSVEIHPELGRLVPNETVEHDLSPELVAALRADASGLYGIDVVRTRAAAASTTARPAPPAVVTAGQEDVTP